MGLEALVFLALICSPFLYIVYGLTQPQFTLPNPPGSEWEKLRREGLASALPPSPQALEATRSAIAGLQNDDPGFDPETFLQRAEMAYFLLKRALFLSESEALRPIMAPEFYEATAQRVAKNAKTGKIAMCDLTIDRIVADRVERGPAGDCIWVHFDGRWRGRVVDPSSGRVTWDSFRSFPSGEQWLFRRDAGVRTVTSGGVYARKCPACGAPLQLSLDTRCTYCKAALATGAHDWTVAGAVYVNYREPTTDVFDVGAGLDPESGFAAIAKDDPTFSVSGFIKRVAEAFVELEMALESGDLASARGFMSAGLYLGWSMQAEQLRAGGRKAVIDALALTEVTPTAVRHGRAFDDVTVRVSGRRARYIVNASGSVYSGTTTPGPFSEFWTFQRSTGARSKSTPGTLEKSCPNCGAPLTVNAIGECGHCNAAVTSGSFDWVLSRIQTGTESTPPAANPIGR